MTPTRIAACGLDLVRSWGACVPPQHRCRRCERAQDRAARRGEKAS